jgi:hypothetical protein
MTNDRDAPFGAMATAGLSLAAGDALERGLDVAEESRVRRPVPGGERSKVRVSCGNVRQLAEDFPPDALDEASRIATHVLKVHKEKPLRTQPLSLLAIDDLMEQDLSTHVLDRVTAGLAARRREAVR